VTLGLLVELVHCHSRCRSFIAAADHGARRSGSRRTVWIGRSPTRDGIPEYEAISGMKRVSAECCCRCHCDTSDEISRAKDLLSRPDRGISSPGKKQQLTWCAYLYCIELG